MLPSVFSWTLLGDDREMVLDSTYLESLLVEMPLSVGTS